MLRYRNNDVMWCLYNTVPHWSALFRVLGQFLLDTFMNDSMTYILISIILMFNSILSHLEITIRSGLRCNKNWNKWNCRLHRVHRSKLRALRVVTHKPYTDMWTYWVCGDWIVYPGIRSDLNFFYFTLIFQGSLSNVFWYMRTIFLSEDNAI